METARKHFFLVSSHFQAHLLYSSPPQAQPSVQPDPGCFRLLHPQIGPPTLHLCAGKKWRISPPPPPPPPPNTSLNACFVAPAKLSRPPTNVTALLRSNKQTRTVFAVSGVQAAWTAILIFIRKKQHEAATRKLIHYVQTRNPSSAPPPRAKIISKSTIQTPPLSLLGEWGLTLISA